MVKIMSETETGGSVGFGTDVSVSYGCVKIDVWKTKPLFYAWITLPDQRQIQLFVNRETGLVVVDVANVDRKGGIEVFRRRV